MKEYISSVTCPACGSTFSILGQTAEQVSVKCPKCPAVFRRSECGCGCVFYAGTTKASFRLCVAHMETEKSEKTKR